MNWKVDKANHAKYSIRISSIDLVGDPEGEKKE